MKTGIELIAEERQRSIEGKEGWTSEHTDESIASAAACYAMPKSVRETYQSYTFKEPKRFYPRWWPKSWEVDLWKPTPDDRIQELVKAGALIAAEIDRIQAVDLIGVKVRFKFGDDDEQDGIMYKDKSFHGGYSIMTSDNAYSIEFCTVVEHLK